MFLAKQVCKDASRRVAGLLTQLDADSLKLHRSQTVRLRVLAERNALCVLKLLLDSF